MTELTILEDGEEVPAELTVWDGVTENPVDEAALMPFGAWSTVELVSRPSSVVGHRGTSAWCAEGSRRGMTEAVRRRVDALELPLSRTSDGVWFGLHDQTLLRTSGVAIDPTTITWEQLQAYEIAAPVGGDPQFGARPYMRLTTLLEDYGQSHVLFLDPKYHGNMTYRGELLDLVEAAIPNAQATVVIKYFGDNVTLADYARSRGYTTWGYFYESDYLADPAAIIAQTGRWDWLGLNWDAAPSTWADFVALGKPLFGHVVATTVQRDAALAGGANGIICSDVPAIQGAPDI
jgi:glycerophosphoryl diester phosphodiesterase